MSAKQPIHGPAGQAPATPSEPEQYPSTMKMLGRVVVLGWRYRLLFVLSIAFSAAAGGLFGYLPVALEELISSWSAIQNKGDLSPEVTDAARSQMNKMALLTGCLAIPTAGLFYGSLYVGQRLAHTIIRDLRLRFVEHLVSLDLSFHNEAEKGDLMTRMMNDLNSFRAIVQRIYSRLLQKPLTVIGIMVFMFFINVYLGIFLLIAMVPLTIFLVVMVGKIKHRARGARKAMSHSIVAFEQIVSGIRVIKAMGSSNREAKRFSASNQELFDQLMGVTRSRALSEGITYGVIFAALSGFFLLGNWLFEVDAVTPSQLLAGIGALGLLTSELRSSQHALGDLIANTPAAERVFDILDRQPIITDLPDQPRCPQPQRQISLNQVSFRYREADGDVLRHISLSIEVGTTVALVGPSGGGKSTLLDLIPRLHDVTNGSVCWDDTDVRDYQPSSVIQHCAIVQQDAFLFDDTVLENIRYGRPDATIAEVEAAASRANVHADILRLEGGLGYQTRVGDRGSRLSGGQRQRVAIARALLRDAPVLLLDEPTSALDATSEGHVQAALSELMRNRTTIMIAHRLATVKHADQIHVLGGKDQGDQRGQIIESGTHQELIAAGGIYADLVAKQDLT